MPPKRATFYSYGDDAKCLETKKFIEDAGYILDTRDISKSKFSFDELSRMIGYIDIKHFINQMSPSFTKYKLDKELPSRDEILKLMAEDYTLIKSPIIRTARLLTVGCNQKRIMEMLQISMSQDQLKEVDGNQVNNRSNGKNDGSNGRSNGKQNHRSGSSGRSNMKNGDRQIAASK